MRNDGGIPPHSSGLDAEQRNALPPFAALRAFEAIGSCGGIRRAATALSIDHAAISRHLRALEIWAGAALLDRRPGAGGQLTPLGAQYHQAISKGFSLMANASLDLVRRRDDTRLVLLCAAGLASEWLSGRVGQFAKLSPRAELEIQPTDATPDRDTHNVDAHIHYRIDTDALDDDPEIRSVELARPPTVAVASPSFVAAFGPFETPRDLLRSSLLHEANFDQWRRWFAQYEIDTGDNISGPKFWQAHLTLSAAKKGQGIALSNMLLVRDTLDRKELVQIGDWNPVYLGRYVFTARRNRWRSPLVTVFRRWLESSIKTTLG